MRETKQLHAVSKNPPFFRGSAAPTHSRIKSASSNFQWQRKPYGGNVSSSFSSQPGASSLAPIQSGLQFSAEARSYSAHRSSWQLFCLRDAVKSQIDGGCSAYD